MKITVTGSLGHISQPLTKELVEKGHDVTVVSSKEDKKEIIEGMGAKAAIGSLEDVDFVKASFAGADAVYTMVPPPSNFFDPSLDMDGFYWGILNNYVAAIKSSGVRRVVHLSSIGAHMEKDSGIILVHHRGEELMSAIEGLDLTIMRPTAFYYNLLAFIPGIKHSGTMVSNYGGEDVVSWVSPIDIAAAVAEELVKDSGTEELRYVASEELSCNALASILGSAIGKPDLKWIVASDEAMQQAYEGFGMPAQVAKALIQMNSKMHSGELFSHYRNNRPAVFGKVKLDAYAKEFAAAYAQA